MKKLLFSLLLSFACLTATACTSADERSVQPSQLLDPMEMERPSDVTVVGSGKILVAPDMATVYVGVETLVDGEQIAAGQADNTAAVSRVLTEIRNADICESDISTRDYNVYKRYDYNTERLVGYRILQMIEFKTGNLGTLDQLIAKLIEAGANQFNGICFGLKDPTEQYNLALKEAVQNARSKAEAILETSDLNVLQICEQNHCCHPYWSNSLAQRELAAADEETDTPAGNASTVCGGELTVEATVKMVFEIK